jgi:flavin reductase (DIM6/NTAB) family NADH-FMN oxidoreductase RutF
MPAQAQIRRLAMKNLIPDLLAGVKQLPSFPVVLVTVGENIMTAAAFHFYSFTPPMVMVGIMPEKYSYELLQREKEFGINIPRADQLELVRFCGKVSGRNSRKYVEAKLTPRKAAVIRGHLIEECPLNLECVVVHQVDHPGTHRWFIGEVRAVHMEESYRREQSLMYWNKEFRKVGELLLKV